MSDVQPRGYVPPPARPVSFWVAIFLALLLLVSAGLNVLLLIVSAFSSIGSDFAGVTADEGYTIVTVGGDRQSDKRVLRIPIDGPIAEVASPLLGGRGGTVSQVDRALRLAGRDDSIRAVIFDINTPGGGVTDSDEIHRRILEFRKDHPGKTTCALLGDVAASGGYYVAVACQHIMARPTSITGSIGVIMQAWNVDQAMQKLGIEQVTILSEHTPYKDMLSPTRPIDEAEVGILRSIVEQMYDRFVTVVDEGRPNLERDRVVQLANGAVYSAQQAHEHGLVDSIGSAADALAWVQRSIDVNAVQLVEQRRVPTFWDLLFRAEASASATDVLVGTLRATTGPRLLYYWPAGR